jgi:hypothetical protein
MTIPERLLWQLQRLYYFAEAMAFYEVYYSPVLESTADEKLRYAVNNPLRAKDQPLTWVPIIWHATSLEKFEKIVQSGEIKGPVSLTELPIGEIDRIRLRMKTNDQMAIGFPRRFLESKGIAPVIYTKHSSALSEVIDKYPEVAKALDYLLERKDDTASFLEIRTKQNLSISNAVWFLTPHTKDPNGVDRLWLPGLEAFQEKWGRISLSLWDRQSLLSVLHGWQFLEQRRDSDGTLEEAVFVGQKWWARHSYKQETYKVTMPAGRHAKILFDVHKDELPFRHEGPLRYIDIARRFKRLLREVEGGAPKLPYAIIPDLPDLSSANA